MRAVDVPPEGTGRVDPRKFVRLTAPAAVASLVIGALAVLGYIRVVITTVHPIVMATSGGTADEMVLGLDSVSGVAGRDAVGPEKGAALVRLEEGRFEDLCLIPTVDLPIIGARLSLRLVTSRPVRLPAAALAVTDGTVQALGTPRTTIGASRRTGGAPGAFTVLTDASPESIRLGQTDMSVHGIVLDGGVRLSSLSARPSFGALKC